MPRATFFWVCLAFTSLSLAADVPVDSTSQLETIEADYKLADGPAWNGSALFVPDVKGETIYLYDPVARKRLVWLENSGRISASFFSHGRLFVSDNGNGAIAVFEGKTKKVLTQFDGPKRPAPNDLVVDKARGAYFTLTGQHQVMYVTYAGERRPAVEKVETPNGIILSPDEKTLYVAAYVPKEIWAYDITSPGNTTNGRKIATMDDGDAKGADGMSIDSQGNIYCAGATDVWIWNPAGKLLHKIACPTRPINCAFGDADLKSLYITGFGGLYRLKMNVAGVPSHPAE